MQMKLGTALRQSNVMLKHGQRINFVEHNQAKSKIEIFQIS